MKHKTTPKADLLLDVLTVVENNIYGTIKDNEKFTKKLVDILGNYEIKKVSKNEPTTN